MRVLVVEDDAKLLESIRQGLKESGFGADGAADGRDGARASRSRTTTTPSSST